MESVAKLRTLPHPLQLSLNHRSFSPKPISSLSLKTRFRSSHPLKQSFIKASSSSSPQNPKPFNPFSSSLIKTTCVTVAAAAALLFMRFRNTHAIAAPAPTPTVEQAEDLSSEEKERIIQQHLVENPNDVEALRALMEVKIKAKKLLEAVEVIDRLIELEPDEQEWRLLKGHIHTYTGDFESSRNEFEEILAKDPLRVDAYHGLAMAISQPGEELNELTRRIEQVMEKCKKQRKKSELRDFKLLIAQIRVIEGKYDDALKLYHDLEKEEPRDFRPYLCQGIIYTLLRKKDEAEKHFEKYRRLVPKNHPYGEYFDENILGTKLFSQGSGSEMGGSKN